MTEIKAGDTVRKGRNSVPFKLTTGDSDTAIVDSVNGDRVRVKDHIGKHATYLRSALEVVAVAPEADPESAEKGTFAVAYISPDTGKPLVESAALYEYWVDAEAAAAMCSRAAPGKTFGVLKLVGTVTMKPTWS